MAILTHKFSNRAAADKFFQRLRSLGFQPWQTLKRKGVKTQYIVQYKR